ncbi:unnamed protein product [Dovyalis caffra]|uniref:Uncharacterized protein n=1 Tax=Dovyalis caffra TaxID=77055 RepID=A0AAV1SEI9_9ROSI|nr:unnamed protein product [Dovyalis caffra]
MKTLKKGFNTKSIITRQYDLRQTLGKCDSESKRTFRDPKEGPRAGLPRPKNRHETNTHVLFT